MTDLLQKIFHHFPKYFVDFGGVLSSPKAFVAERNHQPDKSFVDSVVFLGISILIMVVINAFIPPVSSSPWNDLLKEIIRHGVSIVLLAAALTVAWRVVGGRATFKSMFVTYSYFAGVAFVVVNLAMVIVIGASHTLFPVPPGATLNDAGLGFMLLGVLLIGIAMLIWFFVFCWGAFRQLNGLRRGRSIMALLIFLPLAALVVAVNHFIGAGLNLPTQ